MGKFRIYPSKENTIASGYAYENINSSQNNIVDLWYGGGATDTAVLRRNSISRHLVYFDISDLQSKLSNFDINPNYITSYKLKFKNSIPSDKILEPEFEFDVLNKSVASSFDLVSYPINKYWDEGRGHDLERTKYIVKQNGSPILTGYSNWLSATTTTSWDNPGIYSNPTAQTAFSFTQHFSLGSEDLDMDITPLVNDWLSGGSQNYGIAFGFNSYFEALSTDTRYISSFYSNKTTYAFKPYLEVNYNQVIKDDRHWVTNNRVSRLFLYLFSGNQATNYYSAGTVTIKDQSNNVFSALTPTHHSKGVYYVDVLMNGTGTTTTKGRKFKDVWEGVTFVPGLDQTNFTDSFEMRDNYYNNNAKKVNDYAIDFYGLPNNYALNSGEIYRVYADVRMSFSNKKPFTDFGLEYRVTMGLEEPIPWTPMNAAIIDDCLTCYFDLETSWLLNSQVYKIEFRIVEFGTKRLISDTITFRVVNPA